MPPFITFDQKTLHISPAKRAQMDEARLAARLERQAGNPGPGAYEPLRGKQTSQQFAGSTAFKSKRERIGDRHFEKRDVGDPGMYNAGDNTTLAANSSKSFSKTIKGGSNTFGTTVKRQPLSVPNDAPGPGAYEPALPAGPEPKQGSSFASITKRYNFQVGKGDNPFSNGMETPSAGEYDPKLPQHKIRGGDSMFKATDNRFKEGKAVEETAIVGPSSYPQNQNTVGQRASASASKNSPAFASTTMRVGGVYGDPAAP